jgi:signal transduction histidine kinase/ligand-binding sensor domain-containing protein
MGNRVLTYAARFPDRADVLVLVLVCLCLTSSAFAQRVAIEHYGIAEGLPHNRATVILQDRKGYLWFGTEAGLSRFDGYRFRNYSVDDGLPHPVVTDIAEDRNGQLWVATLKGVAKLADPALPTSRRRDAADSDPRRFIGYSLGDSERSNMVDEILVDAQNGLWCATNAGLFHAELSAASEPKFQLVFRHKTSSEAMTSYADREGKLWFAYAELLIRVAGSQISVYPPPPLQRKVGATGMTEHQPGRLLVGYMAEGVFEFTAPTNGGTGTWSRFPVQLGPRQTVRAMFTDSSGAVLIGTDRGMIHYENGHQARYAAGADLDDQIVRTISEDSEGNIWVGTSWSGVYKLATQEIVAVRGDDLPSEYFARVFQDRDGRTYAILRDRGTFEIVGEGARMVPNSDHTPLNSMIDALQDRRGDWWISTRNTLFRFSGPLLQLRRGRQLTPREGIGRGRIYFVEEDPAGQLWTSVDGTLHRLDEAGEARPVGIPGRFDAMLAERSGSLWLASLESTVARWSDGNGASLELVEGLPKARVRRFFQDSRGWVWVLFRTSGVSVTTDPGAAHPAFRHFSQGSGLASDQVSSITEDQRGRIYLGTVNGLDRFDPDTDRIRHLTRADGLPGDAVFDCLADSTGHIWVATTTGLARLDAKADRATTWQPNVSLTRVRVAGTELPVPERGSAALPRAMVSAWSDSLTVEYGGLRFRNGPRLKYQYRLEGVDRDWSAPTEERGVTYARLGPGSYRFLVRAVSPDDGALSESAVLPIEIPYPIWMRSWFVALLAVSAVGAASVLHRYRVRHLLAMERIRSQIATDLHDDVGSGLAQIAILSEVAKRRTAPDAAPLLTETATLARSMRESMSDIVWSVDPTKDRAADLVRRMKQTCFNALQANGLQVEFLSPSDADLDRIDLTPDRRRHVLLIFKEAIANAARHAHATHVRIAIDATPTELCLRVDDNGHGFDPRASVEGHGIQSIRQRARALGASLDIDAAPGFGTSLRLTVPLR